MGNINIELPEELHKQIKVYCATHDISIKDFLVKSLEEEAKESGKKGKNS